MTARTCREIQIPGEHGTLSDQVRAAGGAEAAQAGAAQPERADALGVREPLLGVGPQVPEVGKRQPPPDAGIQAHQQR